MTSDEFLAKLASLDRTDKSEHLLKEKATWHIGDKAVLVETTELDLDTDGGNDPAIQWDRTHQSDTSLHWPKGDPVDSNATRFVVIPIGWGERHGIRLGDVGLAQIRGCKWVFGVIVADLGPRKKIGEGSIALHRAFGQEPVRNGRIRDVGMDGPFRMLLFKNSGDGVCHNNATNEARALTLWAGLT